jgi:hypothetical protein
MGKPNILLKLSVTLHWRCTTHIHAFSACADFPYAQLVTDMYVSYMVAT